MKRVALKRRTPLSRGGTLKRSPMAKKMPKGHEQWGERKAWLRGRSCVFSELGGCWGPLTVDEPWSRAQGGPTDDPRNRIALCIEHNRLKSQDATVMRWARDRGYVISAVQGPAWLAAGGVLREVA